MQPTDFWPLIDTAVKIALGASIAGLSLWLSQHRSNLNKPHSNRRIDILEAVSSDVGNVNHIFAKYSSLVIESTRFGGRWPQARKEELAKVNSELVDEFRKIADAEARLLMLGEKALEKTLRLYGARIAQFRKQVYVGRQDISEQEIVRLKQEILQLREQFYDILSHKYDRLLAS
ncbi:energy transducer TonB [Pseudomaricurvus alcaniphilus]|uniref:energy transducer TonB n=1 Tax=Pseudomaricurvus alcaniphilus TaxID=1166482 RepID=UPI00140E11C7|nr:energy transducer TonB [Pseudomaricurvus alcaniphilus]NHN37812.1 energy transducer TonB [Pseudomaricurvus alcaniphilus]